MFVITDCGKAVGCGRQTVRALSKSLFSEGGEIRGLGFFGGSSSPGNRRMFPEHNVERRYLPRGHARGFPLWSFPTDLGNIQINIPIHIMIITIIIMIIITILII